MFTEKDLLAGETVLLDKRNQTKRRLYLGCAGLVHFASLINIYEEAGRYFTIEELNNSFTIEQPKSKVVPLEKKVYDFVPVRVRDRENQNWLNAFLVVVIPDSDFPYKVLDYVYCLNTYKYCEFINEQ